MENTRKEYKILKENPVPPRAKLIVIECVLPGDYYGEWAVPAVNRGIEEIRGVGGAEIVEVHTILHTYEEAWKILQSRKVKRL